jgi:DNA polymerase-1
MDPYFRLKGILAPGPVLSMEKTKRILVIDAHAMAYRGHFALERQNLRNAAGQSTGAIFGFFRMFFKILVDFAPAEVLVAWDPPGGSFRGETYKDYKATRKPMPDDLRSQITEIKDIVRQMGFATCEIPNFEADDVMGTIAERFGKSAQIYLLTSDKDCFQLINKNVHMLKGAKGVTEFIEVDPEWVEREIGVKPEQIPDYMGLVGDTSDNIPGAKGIGPKTAAELIREFGNLDNLYNKVDSIPREGLRTKLQESRENALLSRDLATIRKDIPEVLKLPEEQLKTPDYLKEEIIHFFRTQGYRMIADDLVRAAGKKSKSAGAKSQAAEAATPAPAEKKEKEKAADQKPEKKSKGKKTKENKDQPDMFSPSQEASGIFSSGARFQSSDVRYAMIRDLDTLKAALAKHAKRRIVAVDTETDSADAMQAVLVGISLSSAAKEADYIALPPIGSPHEKEGLSLEEARPLLAQFFAHKETRFIGQNIKYDFQVLRRHGMEISTIAFDTMIAGHLLSPGMRRSNLDDLALDYLSYNTIRYEDVVGSGRSKTTMDKLPPEAIRDYACEDADITLQLYHAIEPKLKEAKLDGVNAEMEVPLLRVLADVEANGVAIDTPYFEKLSKEYTRHIARLEKTIHDEAGLVFNVNSTKELQFVLLEKLRLPMGKKIKTGFSTDQRELERMRGLHPMIDHLLEYRKYTKLLSTYIDALPGLVNAGTGRIHTTLHQAIAATGRLSSMDPNLQNIPVREDLGRAIRRGFIPAKGHELLSLDYSQVELRIMAHYSKDKALMEAFTRDDVDIHARTAASLFGVGEDEVTPDMRSKAKVVNFSIIYGVTDFGLSQSLSIPRAEAKQYIERFFQRYPGVKKYMDDTIEFCVKNGYVETLFGRRRQIPDIKASNRFRREGAERTAINTPIQGTSADLIKQAMIRIHAKMKSRKMKSLMILQVHDELLFEVPAAEKDDILKLAHSEMENADLRVPLRVDAGWGKNWDETKG